MSAALIARESWTRTPRPVDKLSPLVAADVRGIAVHWPGSTGGSWADPTLAQSAARLESERRQHTSPASNDPTKPWSDIAYSLAVDLAGRLFDCRGIAYRPAANGDRVVNERYVAVTVLMGPGDVVTSAAVDGVRAARALVLARYPHAVAVVGHRDLHPTTCPGDALYGDVRSGVFLLPAAALEDDMPTADEFAKEVWGPGSPFVVPVAGNGELHLPDGRPAISPITALAQAYYGVAALEQQITGLVQQVTALAAKVAGPSAVTLTAAQIDQLAAAVAAKAPGADPVAIAHAVRAEFSAHPLT